MSAYDGPAADPAALSALAASLRARTARLHHAGAEVRLDPALGPRLAGTLRELDEVLLALVPLVPALQRHASVLADTRTDPSLSADELTLHRARGAVDQAALVTQLDRAREALEAATVTPRR